jgi:hypothetical protein
MVQAKRRFTTRTASLTGCKEDKMDEIKLIDGEKQGMNASSMSMNDKINFLIEREVKKEAGEVKKKRMRPPKKSKVRRGKLKKGWVGIIKIDENGNISGEKQKIDDSTYKLKDGTYHSLDGKEVLFWEGKFPIVIQPTWKKNPLQLRKEADEINETYGQKYIMARMLGDTIKVKKKAGNIIIWLMIAGAVLFAISYFTGGA